MTPTETSTNAKSVPILERSAKVPISSSPAGRATAKPAIHVATAGVRKRGCTLLNREGRRPSLDMANHTRACPIWKTRMEEIMPSKAPISTTRCVQCNRLLPVTWAIIRSVLTSGAALSIRECQGTSPVSTMATEIYKTVATTSVAMMPIGTSRCGFLNAAHQNHRDQHHDDEGREVEAEVPAGRIQGVAV